MDKELLSIKQFAEAVGQTQQAIYQQLNKRLTSYVVLKNGKKYVKAEAVGLYAEQEFNNKFNELNGVEQLIEAQNKQIEMLQSAIEDRNKQIKFLQDQLSDMTAALKASQSIQAMYMQQIEDKKHAEQEQEQQQKKGLFARIFGSRKHEE